MTPFEWFLGLSSGVIGFAWGFLFGAKAERRWGTHARDKALSDSLNRAKTYRP